MRLRLSLAVPLILLATASPWPLWAQAGLPQAPEVQHPVGATGFDLALGYQYLRANAPPAACGCFNMNGGFVSANLPIWSWLSAAVEVTGGHATHISPLGQDLTLMTYTAGPRVTFGTHRVTPFAQALVGAAHGSDSYFPQNGSYTTGATSFAFTAGGGFDLNLNHRIAVRMVEAQYLQTAFPNGSDGEQHHLTVGAGLVLKFGKKHRQFQHPVPPPPSSAPAVPPPPPPPPPPPVATTPEVPPSPSADTSAALAAPTVAPPAAAAIPDIFFDTNSDALRSDAEPSLAQATSLLQTHPDQQLQLAGYADARGSVTYNLALSKRRARSVQRALIRRGVDRRHLSLSTRGESGAVCTAQKESCWQRNRRVTITPRP